MPLEDQKLLVEDKLTKFTEEELIYALKNGFEKIQGQPSKIETIAILYAHVILEVGHGQFCHNWNLGNIKKTLNHPYCMFRCSEIIDGKEIFFDPPHPQTHFNAYGSLTEGCAAYLGLLSKKQLPWQEIINGNPIKYSAALKSIGYYTASLSIYTKTVVALFNEFMKKSEKLLTWQPSIPELFNSEEKKYFKEIAAWSLDKINREVVK